jgi:hypothetical protein
MPQSVSGFGRRQIGVALSMGVGFSVTLASLRLASGGRAPGPQGLWWAAAAADAFWLFLAVALLARHRFFSAEDIDAALSPSPSARAAVLQALIRNTLEQTLLAWAAYGAWLFVGGPRSPRVIAVCVVLFALGRGLFFVGYGRGAAGRALGFTLTFFPSAALLLLSLPSAATMLWTSLR